MTDPGSDRHRQGSGPLTSTIVAAALLRDGVGVRLRVNGSSMAPALHDGDVVELEPVASEAVRTGDVVFAVRPEGGYMLHRVVRRPGGRMGGYIRTRGDALWRLDPPVARSQVIGRMRRAWRGSRLLHRRRPVRDALRARLLLLRSHAHYTMERGRRVLRGIKARATGA
jgi:hypothetical protein